MWAVPPGQVPAALLLGQQRWLEGGSEPEIQDLEAPHAHLTRLLSAPLASAHFPALGSLVHTERRTGLVLLSWWHELPLSP